LTIPRQDGTFDAALVPDAHAAAWALPALCAECELYGLARGVGRAFGVGRSTGSEGDEPPVLLAHRAQRQREQWACATIAATSRPRVERAWLAEQLSEGK
jgi:hypothetical protein